MGLTNSFEELTLTFASEQISLNQPNWTLFMA